MAVFYCIGDLSYYFSNGAINTICNSGASFEPWVTTQTCVCCISHFTRVHSIYFSLYREYSVCVCYPIYSGRQTCHLFWTSDLWAHQPGSHRRKVTQDFSAFLLRCLPQFFSGEGFSHPFPSSTVKSNFVHPRINRSPLAWHDFFRFIFILFWRRNLSSCDCTEIRTHVPTSEGFEVTN